MKRIIQISFLVAIILPFFSCEREIPVTSILMNQNTAELFIEDYLPLYVTYTPDDATDKTTSWNSSRPSVASVNQEGLVLALSEGQTIITATVGKLSTSCHLFVRKRVIPAAGITINQEGVDLFVADSILLYASITPSDATDSTVIWGTSKPSVASVTQDGLVRALSVGQTRISASIGGLYAYCDVAVQRKDIPATSIAINQESVDLFIADSIQLYVSITPTDATEKVLWGSSKPTVASISQNGLVQALSEGRTTITATIGKLSSICEVTVQKKVIPVSSIALDKQRVSLNKNATEVLNATVIPDNATNKIVQWSSENESIATVDQNGVVFGVEKGVTAITARLENAATSCIVTVIVPVDSIVLNKSSVILKPKGEYQIMATVYPIDASEPNLTWETDNPEVALVDNNGVITALKPGKAIVSVKSGDIISACDVLVFETTMKMPEFIDLGLSVRWASFNVGATEIWEMGNPYAWGEIETKEYYDWYTYKHCKGSDYTLTKYCCHYTSGYEHFHDDKVQLDLEDDVAFQEYGEGCRIPTAVEWVELLSKCKWEFVRINGVAGNKVTSNVEGYQDRWIFLPFAYVECGLRSDVINEEGGWYGSSSLDEEFDTYEVAFFMSATNVLTGWIDRCYGLRFRPVQDK